MEFLHNIFATDRMLWIVWLLLIAGVALWGRRILRKIRFRRPRRLHSNESGAGYTMGVVLTIPLFLLLCGMALEVTFLIIAKIGTVYAAYAGARATAVWQTMPGELTEQRVSQAVVSGLAPFAVSVGFDPKANDPPKPLPSYASQMANDYSQALQKSAEPERLDRNMLREHFLRVFRRTASRVDVGEQQHGTEIVVYVRYTSPLIVAGVAPFLDEDHSSPWDYTLTAEVRMTLEAPKSRDGTLGIGYQPY